MCWHFKKNYSNYEVESITLCCTLVTQHENFLESDYTRSIRPFRQNNRYIDKHNSTNLHDVNFIDQLKSSFPIAFHNFSITIPFESKN